MTIDGSVLFELAMRPLPLGLEGLEVAVEREADRELRMFGHTAESLGARWMGRKEIDKIIRMGHAGDVIRFQGIAGIEVPPGSVCVIYRRARTGASQDRCALTVLDGILPWTIQSRAHRRDDPSGQQMTLRPREVGENEEESRSGPWMHDTLPADAQ